MTEQKTERYPADVNGDGAIDGADGYIPNPELEWGYLFDPTGADGVAFNGDEPTQFTGYYFTGNLLTALGAINEAVGPDADGDGTVTAAELALNPIDGYVRTPDDRRFLQSIGPFTLEAGAQQEIVYGLIGAYSPISSVASIAALKQVDALAQLDIGEIKSEITKPKTTTSPGTTNVVDLSQNQSTPVSYTHLTLPTIYSV